MLSAKQGNYW